MYPMILIKCSNKHVSFHISLASPTSCIHQLWHYVQMYKKMFWSRYIAQLHVVLMLILIPFSTSSSASWGASFVFCCCLVQSRGVLWWHQWLWCEAVPSSISTAECNYRCVGANGTFYICQGTHGQLADVPVYSRSLSFIPSLLQVRVVHNSGVGEWSKGMPLGKIISLL